MAEELADMSDMAGADAESAAPAAGLEHAAAERAATAALATRIWRITVVMGTFVKAYEEPPGPPEMSGGPGRTNTNLVNYIEAEAAASMAEESDMAGAEEESAVLAAGLEHAAADRAAMAAPATSRLRRTAVIWSFPWVWRTPPRPPDEPECPGRTGMIMPRL